MEPSILWYDLETFGINPFHDRIAQFAAVRSNFRFQIISDPMVLYVKPSQDYLPDPSSCLITGITPQDCFEKGISEYAFARTIFDEMMIPESTIAGYNSINFDDEFIRNLFYRNFFDPYKREYANGNSRWDIINLIRAAHDLRPRGMNWPKDGEGKPSFKLETLAAANGIGHKKSHDALSDVLATIELAKRIQEEHPRLFHWSFSSRTKDSLRKLFDLNTRPILVYSSAELTRKEGCTTLICPLGVPGEESGQGRNTMLCADLRYDPKDLLNLSVEKIRQRLLFPSTPEKNRKKYFPILSIRINRAPFIAPQNTLGREEAIRLNIDIDSCIKNHKLLLEYPNLTAKIREAFNNPYVNNLPEDPDYQIYSGFFKHRDREQFSIVHEHLNAIIDTGDKDLLIRRLVSIIQKTDFIERERIIKLFNRLLGRNFNEFLGKHMTKKWQEFCQNRLIFPLMDGIMDIQRFQKKLSKLQEDADTEQLRILTKLNTYFEKLKKDVLTLPDSGQP